MNLLRALLELVQQLFLLSVAVWRNEERKKLANHGATQSTKHPTLQQLSAVVQPSKASVERQKRAERSRLKGS